MEMPSPIDCAANRKSAFKSMPGCRGFDYRVGSARLWTLDFVARREVHAAALEHDRRGAIPLHREVDRALEGRLLDVAAEHVLHVDAREDLGNLDGLLGFHVDAERFHGVARLPEDVDDVDGGAATDAEQHHLH